VLYVMVSGLIAGPGTSKPTVAFGTPSLGTGTPKTEIVPVASASQAVSQNNYKVNLALNGTAGSAVAVAAAGSESVAITGAHATYTFKVIWTDIGGEGTLNGGDSFTIKAYSGTTQVNLVTGSYTFYLLWSDGSSITSVTFSVT